MDNSCEGAFVMWKIRRMIIVAVAMLLVVAISAAGSYFFFVYREEAYECRVEGQQTPGSADT